MVPNSGNTSRRIGRDREDTDRNRGGGGEAISTYATALEVYPDHIPTMQAMARLQLRSGKVDPTTHHMLGEIALRGENQQWRDGAGMQAIKMEQ